LEQQNLLKINFNLRYLRELFLAPFFMLFRFSIFFINKLQFKILFPYLAVFINLLIVITKAGGIRPNESLATLQL